MTLIRIYISFVYLDRSSDINEVLVPLVSHICFTGKYAVFATVRAASQTRALIWTAIFPYRLLPTFLPSCLLICSDGYLLNYQLAANSRKNIDDLSDLLMKDPTVVRVRTQKLVVHNNNY